MLRDNQMIVSELFWNSIIWEKHIIYNFEPKEYTKTSMF